MRGEVEPPPPPTGGGVAAWRLFLPVAAVGLLAQLSAAQEFFGALTKPLVIGLLRLAGLQAAESGTMLTVGALEVPWSRDCAGLNLLVVLLAVTVWMQRHRRLDAGFWLRVLGALPAALVANVLRVLTVVAYRAWFAPAVESPQLHYFMGLAWLVPFALLLVPPDGRGRLAGSFELLHAAAVLALVAPLGDAPGGLPLTLAAVVTLAHCRLPDRVSPRRLAVTAAWLAAAAVIILAGVESFWLPWLLVCPLLASPSWVFSVEGILLLAGSQPMFQLLVLGEQMTWIGLALAGWRMFRNPPGAAPDAAAPRGRPALAALALSAAAFCLPFLGSALVTPEQIDLHPPAPVVQREIPGDGYQVRLPRQPDALALFWYLPSGSQRHHTLKVCMKYRGVELAPASEDSPVMTDGTFWMREFFLLPQGLLTSHADYVWATLLPGRSPGIHLIAVAPRESMAEEEFARESALLVQAIDPPEDLARR